MTQPNNNPTIPLDEFVKLAFAELRAVNWNEGLEDLKFDLFPELFEKALAPLTIRLYQLTQIDNEVYWWLLLFMSKIDVFKSEQEDFRKSAVFKVLSELKPEHAKLIITNCVPQKTTELYKALNNKDIDSFKNILPSITDNETIFNICRVLERLFNVRETYKDVLSRSRGDALARLYMLISRCFYCFEIPYIKNKRSCDGMMRNIFLTLYNTQFRKNKAGICFMVLHLEILWTSSLVLAFLNNERQMPNSMRAEMYGILHGLPLFNKLKALYDDCDTEEQKQKLFNKKGSCLKLESYTFVYPDKIKKRHTPPFACVDLDGSKEIGNANLGFLDGKELIPMEELKTLEAQEGNKNIGGIESVIVYECNPKPVSEVEGRSVINKAIKPNIKPMYFPDEWEIPIDKRKEFLAKLHEKLKGCGYLKQDSLSSFIFIFSGCEDVTDEKGDFNAVDWGKGSDQDYRQLQVFCIAFYKMRMGSNEHKKSPWKKLTPLFTVNGNPINDLSTNASKAFQEKLSINSMSERITDVQKEILQK